MSNSKMITGQQRKDIKSLRKSPLMTVQREREAFLRSVKRPVGSR